MLVTVDAKKVKTIARLVERLDEHMIEKNLRTHSAMHAAMISSVLTAKYPNSQFELDSFSKYNRRTWEFEFNYTLHCEFKCKRDWNKFKLVENFINEQNR